MCSHCRYATVGILLWLCLYWFMRAIMGSSVRNPNMKSHMFLQSRQDGCECCRISYRLMRVWMAKQLLNLKEFHI